VQCWGGDFFGELGVNRQVYLLLPGLVVISNEIFKNGFEPLN